MSINIIQAQELERKRLSSELHDEFGQSLTAIGINFSVIRKKLGAVQSADISSRMQDITHSIELLSDQVHNLSLDLRPPMLDDLGLIPTLRWFVNQFQERNGIQVHFSVEGVAVVNIPNQVAVSMYRVFQEALNNITKHADASSVHVRLETSGNSISLEVKDDGRGFDTSEMKQREPGASGLGLIGMQERLDLVEGSMSIHSTRNVGTTLRADVPIQGVLRGYN